MLFSGYFRAQLVQGFARRPVRHFSICIEARTMAGTGEAIRGLFEGAAEVGAGQAEGGESVFGVDEKRRDFGEGCARADGIVIRRANIEFGLGRGIWFVIEEAEQAAEGERAAEPEKASAGEFEKIAAGEIVHG